MPFIIALKNAGNGSQQRLIFIHFTKEHNMPKISEETEQRIIAMRRAGTSAAEIARQLKLDPKTVRRITGPSIPRITSTMRLQIIKMVREGKPRTHVARLLGVSPTRVARVVRDA